MSAAIAGADIEIVEGADEWLFLRRFAATEVLERQADLTAWRKSRLPMLAALFAGRNARLAARGKPYLVVIAPEKASIYPEMLPPGSRIADPTAAELLTRECANAGIDTVDLTPLLRSAKGPIDLYAKVDSHWSYYGAYVAYRAIMRSVRRYLRVPEIGPDELAFSDREGFGDLGVHLRPERRGALQHVDFERRDYATVVQAYDQREQAFGTHTSPQGRGKALVLRDSFINYLAPYLSRTFAETHYPAPPFSMLDDMIDDLKPDIVIHQTAERALFDQADGLADWQPRSWRQIYLEAHANPNETDLVRPLRQALCEGNYEVALPLAWQLSERADGRLDHNLAEALLASGAIESALQICGQVESRRGRDPFVYYLEAHARLRQGDLPGAISSLREALAMRPGHARLLHDLGWSLAADADYSAAVEAFRAAVAAAPASAETWGELARVQSVVGATDAAVVSQREADRLRGQ